MPELALDHVQRHALTRQLNRVSMAQLVWSEASPDAGFGGVAAKLASDCCS